MACIESKHRENTVAVNMKHFEDMLKGKFTEKEVEKKDGKGKEKIKVQFCIRAKMNM